MSKKKRRELRCVFNTNAPHASSGYSVEMRDVLYRLVADGWPIAISAFYGVEGGPIDVAYPSHLNPNLKGLLIKHYPKMGDAWGSDAMFYHSQEFKADVVFSMQDIWTLNTEFLSKMPRWIPWMPIDKEPIPINVIEKLQYAYKIACFSQFGHDLLLDKGFSSTLIYEGTDTEIFKPQDRQKARKRLNIPQDAFLFSVVGANKENPPRKGFQQMLEAFKLFHDKHPEAALIVNMQQRSPAGFPFSQYAQYLKIPKERIFYMNDYLSMFVTTSDAVAEQYSASDALLHPSQTEGFGLCIIEAQSCGIPVIIQNCQSMPELIIEGTTGFGAKTLYRRFTNDLAMVNVADSNSVYDCMEKTYRMVKKDPKKVATDCRKHIVDKFNIDTIVKNKWIPFLEELQEEIKN